MTDTDGLLVKVAWVANPFRGDKFEAAWLPAAEAVLDYGATGWALFRSEDGLLDFIQLAFVPDHGVWERYWYSEEITAARADAQGLYQVPLLPTFHRIAGIGSLRPAVEAMHPS
jgi:hypothetical protein